MEIIRGKHASFIDARELADQLAGYDRVHIDIGTGDGRFVRHVAQIIAAPAIGKARAAGDDQDAPQLPQRHDDLLGQGIGEEGLLGIAAEIGEGEHGNRRPNGLRRVDRWRLMVPYEAIAHAWDRRDPATHAPLRQRSHQASPAPA